MATPGTPPSFNPQAPSQTATLPPSVPGDAATLPPPPPVSDGVTLALAPAVASPGPAVAVPGYEILRELGRGGMGVVYQARHIKLNRPVALKMILAGSHAGAAELVRFQTEAEAIARLRHPNIVQVYEVGEHEGKPYFSLEFCPGGSLEKKLDGTPLPAREAASLVGTLARAMQVAHEQHVIHRDLKPANVLLAQDGTPKITDFGLAKKLDEASQTQSGAVMGTPSYMAPEQAGGKSADIGPLVDVYALGAILYECLTGRPPFKAATALDTIMQVVSDEPVPPGQLNAKVPADLETICLKCLHKEPHKRYDTAREVADELRRFLDGVPILARPAGALERLGRWCQRRPSWAALIGVSVLALLTLLGGGAWFTQRLRQELQLKEQAQRDLQSAFTRELAEDVDGDLGQIAAGPQTVARLLSARADWGEEHLEPWMRSALADDERLFGLCAAFEPFEFDSGREDFALYVYRTPDGSLGKKHLLHGEYAQTHYREWDWYRTAKDTENGRWSKPYIDKDGGDVPMVTYSAPVLRRGRFVGVVTADLSRDRFNKQLQKDLEKLDFGPGSYAFVVSASNAKGRFISHPDERFDLRTDLVTVAERQADPALTAVVDRALRGETGEARATDFATGRPARFLFAPVKSSGWSVVVVIPDPK